MKESFNNTGMVRSGNHRGIPWAVLEVDVTLHIESEFLEHTYYNGYVEIPENHPWHGIGNGKFEVLDSLAQAHGGITYNYDDVWGFDTAHGFNYPYGPIVMTLDDVVDETIRLADQIADSRHSTLCQ